MDEPSGQEAHAKRRAEHDPALPVRDGGDKDLEILIPLLIVLSTEMVVTGPLYADDTLSFLFDCVKNSNVLSQLVTS